MTSIFAVGRLGKESLAAATLASTTANITGFAIYQGLCTGLDTLCSQAYGSGRLHLVGLHMQRMQIFLMLITIPMAVLWFNAQHILSKIIPDPAVALLAGQYLRIIVFGAPGVSEECWNGGCHVLTDH
jgi:MATE family multidrug resistance protein